MDLDHDAVCRPRAVGDPVDGVRKNDDRDGAVQWKVVAVSEAQICQSNGHQNSRYGMGNKHQRVQKTAKRYLGSNHDPRHQHAQNHCQRGHGKHEDQRIDERPRPDMSRDFDVMFERQRRKSFGRRQLQIRQQRSPQEHGKGDKNFDREVKEDKRKRGPLPAAEGDLPGAISPPRDDCVLFPLFNQPHVQKGQGETENEHDRAVGARHAVVRQTRGRSRGRKNKRAKHVNARRQPDDRRDFKNRNGGHDKINHHARNGRPGDRNIDLQKCLELANPRSIGRLFQRRVHGSVGGGQHKECAGHKRDTLHKRHAGEAVQVEWRLAQGEKLLQPFVDQTDARAEQQDPRDGAQKNRNENSDGEQNVDCFFERDVRPHENPDQRDGDQQSDRDAGNREENRIEQDLVGSRRQVDGGEVFQGERNVFSREAGAKAHENHHQHRQPDQHQ